MPCVRLPAQQDFLFALDPEAERELDGLIAVWTLSLRGLTKGITRMRTTSLIRHCKPVGHAAASNDYAAAG